MLLNIYFQKNHQQVILKGLTAPRKIFLFRFECLLCELNYLIKWASTTNYVIYISGTYYLVKNLLENPCSAVPVYMTGVANTISSCKWRKKVLFLENMSSKLKNLTDWASKISLKMYNTGVAWQRISVIFTWRQSVFHSPVTNYSQVVSNHNPVSPHRHLLMSLMCSTWRGAAKYSSHSQCHVYQDRNYNSTGYPLLKQKMNSFISRLLLIWH